MNWVRVRTCGQNGNRLLDESVQMEMFVKFNYRALDKSSIVHHDQRAWVELSATEEVGDSDENEAESDESEEVAEAENESDSVVSSISDSPPAAAAAPVRSNFESEEENRIKMNEFLTEFITNKE